MEKTGQVLDGSAFAEKKITVYESANLEIREMRNKAGEHSVIIMMKKFPAVKIRGSASVHPGEFQLTSLEYLGSNLHGWNEYKQDIFGSGRLVLGEFASVFSIVEEIEMVQISRGRIHRYETSITGNEALAALNNRYERILSLAEWMNSLEDAPKGLLPKQFEKYWKPVLFPEIVSKKKRPEGWQLENDRWIKAEDIRWNTSYTERVFPELLRNIRDSGTLLRDWEEALDWIYTEYEWERILEQLSQRNILTRKNTR
jgi:hypothetical protein